MPHLQRINGMQVKNPLFPSKAGNYLFTYYSEHWNQLDKLGKYINEVLGLLALVSLPTYGCQLMNTQFVNYARSFATESPENRLAKEHNFPTHGAKMTAKSPVKPLVSPMSPWGEGGGGVPSDKCINMYVSLYLQRYQTAYSWKQSFTQESSENQFSEWLEGI
jgi:hypothetical protein